MVPPPSPDPFEGCLDRGTLDQLLALDDGGTGLIEEMLGLFREDSQPRLDAIAEGVAKGDLEGVAEVAHALKGSSGTIGAVRLKGLAADFERQSRAGTLRATPETVEDLRSAYGEAIERLEAFIAERNAG